MTKEEKITWLVNASNDEVLEQMKWSVIAMTKADSIAMRIEGQEDYDLVLAELKRRLGE
jgi:hypothetical protein